MDFNFLIFLVLSIIHIIWSIPFILFLLIGARIFSSTDPVMIMTIGKKIKKYSSILIEGEKPLGFFFGKWYVGYIEQTIDNNGRELTKLWILCTKTQFDALKLPISQRNNAQSAEIDDLNIEYWYITGSYFNREWRSRKISIPQTPRKIQETIIEQIEKIYNEKGHCVCFLYGNPGSGKSMIGLLLAKKLNGHYTKQYVPIEPGNDISYIYACVSPSKESPLIIVLEEIDEYIDDIKDKKIQPHNYVPIQITDKTSWNSFLDDIDNNLYPNVIIIMTSNKSIDYINEKDNALFREGRVNFISKI